MGEAFDDFFDAMLNSETPAGFVRRPFVRRRDVSVPTPKPAANPFARKPTMPTTTHAMRPLLRNCRIVGSQFRDDAAQAIYAALAKGDELQLQLDPANPHDPLAVKVIADGTHVGYIPREMSAVFHLVGVGADVIAVVSEVGSKGSVMLAVGIYAES